MVVVCCVCNLLFSVYYWLIDVVACRSLFAICCVFDVCCSLLFFCRPFLARCLLFVICSCSLVFAGCRYWLIVMYGLLLVVVCAVTYVTRCSLFVVCCCYFLFVV